MVSHASAVTSAQLRARSASEKYCPGSGVSALVLCEVVAAEIGLCGLGVSGRGGLSLVSGRTIGCPGVPAGADRTVPPTLRMPGMGYFAAADLRIGTIWPDAGAAAQNFAHASASCRRF